MNKQELKQRIAEFIEQEMRSCSMDIGCITPLYIYRMWGGQVSQEEITASMTEMKYFL